MSDNVSPEDLRAPSLATAQRSLCGYLRHPDVAAIPDGLDARRVAVYRDLVFNNIESLVSGVYPVMKAVLADRWTPLIRAFITDYRAATPYFTRLPNEFCQFVQLRNATHADPPYLVELARHELLELELLYRDRADEDASDAAFADAGLALSSVAQLARYRYPVHRLSGDSAVDAAPDAATCLVLYRNTVGEVEVMQLSEAAFQLLTLISQNPGFTGGYWLRSLVDQWPHELTTSQARGVVDHGLALLERLYDLHVLYAASVPALPGADVPTATC